MEFKKYNHREEEKKISDFWIKKGLFKPKKNKLKKKFFHSNSTTKYNWKITHGPCIK